jgi:hypothetical protein
MRWTLICLVGLVIALATTGAAAEESYVRARLVADAGRLHSGESFHLGVLLEPEPGWHVYWRHPGEAGLSTEVLFNLPDGFEVGELAWPVPVAFEQPGEIIGYGYEDDVVLAAPVTIPADADPSVPVKITASWLACKDRCVLGSAELEAVLPLEGAELETARDVFEGWDGLLPGSDDGSRFSISVTGGPIPAGGSAGLSIWLNWTEAPGPVEYFPDPGPGLKVEGVRTQTRGRLTRIDLKATRLKNEGPPTSSLRSLVVTTGNDTKRNGLVIDVPID